MPERVFPDTINSGDTVRLEFPVPTDGFTQVVSGSLRYTLGDTVVTLNLAVEEDNLVGNLTISEARSGTIKYQVQAVGLSGVAPVVRTIETGEANYVNPTQTAPTADENILASLQSVLEAKLQGRQDIQSYSIGGRQVNTFSIAELNEEINKVRARIATYNRRATGGIRKHIQWRARR